VPEFSQSLGLECPVRSPSFSTHLSESRTQIHSSCVVGLVPIPSRQAAKGSVSIQLASVDDRGLLCFWVLSEVSVLFLRAADENRFTCLPIHATHILLMLLTWKVAGNGAEHGQHTGASVRLVCSRSLSVWGAESFSSDSDALKAGAVFDLSKMSMDELLGTLAPGPSVLGVAFYPWEPNHFLVQSSDGRLIHQSRFGSPGHPKQFSNNLEEIPESRVLSVSFSPFHPGYFLVGCADGSVRLHSDMLVAPLVTWAAASMQKAGAREQFDLFLSVSVVNVQWSPRRPAVFFVLDSNGHLHVFDLLQDDTAPIVSETLVDRDTVTSITIGHYPSCPSFIAVADDRRLRLRPLANALATPLQGEALMVKTYFNCAF